MRILWACCPDLLLRNSLLLLRRALIPVVFTVFVPVVEESFQGRDELRLLVLHLLLVRISWEIDILSFPRLPGG